MGLPILRGMRRRWREARKVRTWRRAGGGPPVPHAVKRAVVREHARQGGVAVFVETGTWRGDMVEAVRRTFCRVVSIELDPALAAAARARFASDANVEIREGDSARVLPDVLATLREPAVFWLDGHFSAGDTARGESDTPIRRELELILAHPVRGHVVLVDDAHLFTGEGDYPSVDEVRATVERLRPGSPVLLEDAILRILPASG